MFVWRNPRPHLVIESGGGSQLGNCYYGMRYKVTTREPLTLDQLELLRDAKLLGYGQEFIVHSKTGAESIPTGEDVVPCTVIDEYSGKVLDEPPINPYTNPPAEYPPQRCPFYVYEIERRVDSSD